MTARSEAPASFRSSSVRPWIALASSPAASARSCPDGASSPTSSAPTSRRTARTRCWATCGGSSTRCSRCSSTPCWSTLIFDAPDRRTTRCSCSAAILPWKWFESTVKDGVDVDHGAGAADQADLLPEARPAGRRRRARGIVNFAFGLIPLVGAHDRCSTATGSAAWLLLIPVVAVVQFVFSLSVAIALSRGQRLLPRRRQPRRGTCSGSGSTCRPTLYSPDRHPQLEVHEGEPDGRRRALQPQPVDRTCSSSYRNLIYYGQPPRLARAWPSCCVVVAGPARGRDPAVQAGRADVRQGPVSDGRRSDEPARDERVVDPSRPARRQVQPPADAEADPPGLDRPGARSARATPTSGRCATSSFSVAQGESLGVIGPNGAGKSTLLQVLAGILTPSEGDGRRSTATSRAC